MMMLLLSMMFSSVGRSIVSLLESISVFSFFGRVVLLSYGNLFI